MTTFAELQQLVADITNHPELVVETKIAIRAATLKLHMIDYWLADTVETELAVVQADGMYQISKATEFPSRTRKLLYIQKSVDGTFLTEITPRDVFDDYGQMKNNVYYQIGANVNCRSDTADSSVLLGCVVNPVTTETGYSSWIADDYDFIVAIEASLIVFNSIGESEMVKKLQAMQMENMALLKINCPRYLGVVL